MDQCNLYESDLNVLVKPLIVINWAFFIIVEFLYDFVKNNSYAFSKDLAGMTWSNVSNIKTT